jgi:hypothetical protein
MQVVNQCENILQDLFKQRIKQSQVKNAEFKRIEKELVSHLMLPRNAAEKMISLLSQ